MGPTSSLVSHLSVYNFSVLGIDLFHKNILWV